MCSCQWMVKLMLMRDALTSSFSSLTAMAADRAGEMSTSLTCFEISEKAFFHSVTNGPDEASLAITPTLSYALVSPCKQIVTFLNVLLLS